MEAVQVLTKSHIFSMSVEEADLLLTLDGDTALLYLYILRNGGSLNREDAEKTLKLIRPIDASIKTLESCGLISVPKPKPKPQPVLLERDDTPPTYSVAEVAKAASSEGRFKSLLDETARCLGKVLSSAEMTTLYSIYEYLGLPPEVIILLINWCIRDYEQRYGKGSRPTLRQIEKTAYLWAKDGVLSLELAEAYILKQTERRQQSYEIKKRLGITDRALSPTEEKYVTAWLELGFGLEAITEAYDRTIIQKRELAWAYMNRILESWHKNGYTTIEEIMSGDPREKQQKRDEVQTQNVKPDVSEYERMQRYINKLNGGNGRGS